MSRAASEVEAALLQFAEDELDWGSYGAFTNYYDSEGKTYEVPELGTVTVIACKSYDQDKSYDGWYEDIFVVFKVDSTLYKAEGTYTSYVGSDWNHELTIVQPVEKTYIAYEEV